VVIVVYHCQLASVWMVIKIKVMRLRRWQCRTAGARGFYQLQLLVWYVMLHVIYVRHHLSHSRRPIQLLVLLLLEHLSPRVATSPWCLRHTFMSLMVHFSLHTSMSLMVHFSLSLSNEAVIGWIYIRN
jgi:hypothetical protein